MKKVSFRILSKPLVQASRGVSPRARPVREKKRPPFRAAASLSFRVPPRGWFWVCRAAGGVSRRRPPGGILLSLPRCGRRGVDGNCRPWAARITSAFRRAARVPFRTDEKEPKVRLRTLRRVLRYLREYLASTRELPPLPTGTLAESSIQVADAPNNAHRMARRGHMAENNARSGRSRAPRACAAKPRSFPPPRGRCAPRKGGRASPEALPVRFRRLSGRGIAPVARRRAGCCTPVRSSVNRAPPTLAEGQPEAARGSRGHSPLRLLSPISCPYKKWGRPPGRDPATLPLTERII